jgi:hypothetical protein
MKFADDLAIAAIAHIVRYPPYIDRAGEAEYANVNGGGVRAAHIAAPIPTVAEDSDSADIDVNAFRQVDIDVTEGRENRHGRLRLVDGGFAEVEVEISEDASGDGPPAKSQPTASRDMAKQGRRETGRPAARASRLNEHLGQVVLGTRQFLTKPGPQGNLDARGELLERQPPREKMLAKRDDSLLAVSVRDPQGQIVHDRHTRPAPRPVRIPSEGE